jgi:hypothetical protein
MLYSGANWTLICNSSVVTWTSESDYSGCCWVVMPGLFSVAVWTVVPKNWDAACTDWFGCCSNYIIDCCVAAWTLTIDFLWAARAATLTAHSGAFWTAPLTAKELTDLPQLPCWHVSLAWISKLQNWLLRCCVSYIGTVGTILPELQHWLFRGWRNCKIVLLSASAVLPKLQYWLVKELLEMEYWHLRVLS